MRKSFKIISLLIINLFIFTSFAFADPLHCKNPLESAVDLKMVKLHQYMLQEIANAQTAGAVAAFVINEGQPGRVDAIAGTLGGPDFTIPAVFVNYNIGVELFNLMQAGPVQVNLKVDAISEIRQTHNVIADTTGDDTHTVVVGAHLDSTDKGPGINDNGSGVACALETACKMGWLHIKPKYKVRFAFWSAEEEGLLGSDFYVNNLTPEELAKISMNLNFDMVASPNFVRFVYDGDGSDTPAPRDQNRLKRFLTITLPKRACPPIPRPWTAVPTMLRLRPSI